MELARAFRRRRPEGSVDLVDAHSGLAGLFVGDGVVDRELMYALLERSWVTDETLLAIAAGRRHEARGRYGAALELFEEAIASAHATGAVDLAVHARFDAARVLLNRGQPGDAERADSLLAKARNGARARSMETLAAAIDELEDFSTRVEPAA
jgi:ATP/maltotriose-dependent transcriptional regulator MalT